VKDIKKSKSSTKSPTYGGKNREEKATQFLRVKSEKERTNLGEGGVGEILEAGWGTRMAGDRAPNKRRVKILSWVGKRVSTMGQKP